jgi:hypothetical protein
VWRLGSKDDPGYGKDMLTLRKCPQDLKADTAVADAKSNDDILKAFSISWSDNSSYILSCRYKNVEKNL